jgi:hypothetical protein
MTTTTSSSTAAAATVTAPDNVDDNDSYFFPQLYNDKFLTKFLELNNIPFNNFDDDGEGGTGSGYRKDCLPYGVSFYHQILTLVSGTYIGAPIMPVTSRAIYEINKILVNLRSLILSEVHMNIGDGTHITSYDIEQAIQNIFPPNAQLLQYAIKRGSQSITRWTKNKSQQYFKSFFAIDFYNRIPDVHMARSGLLFPVFYFEPDIPGDISQDEEIRVQVYIAAICESCCEEMCKVIVEEYKKLPTQIMITSKFLDKVLQENAELYILVQVTRPVTKSAKMLA